MDPGSSWLVRVGNKRAGTIVVRHLKFNFIYFFFCFFCINFLKIVARIGSVAVCIDCVEADLTRLSAGKRTTEDCYRGGSGGCGEV